MSNKNNNKEAISGKEKYLTDIFKLDEKTVKSILEIGRLVGTHKYDIWIAKEVKKNPDILFNVKDVQYIIDWANRTRPNISPMSFKEAFKASENWHKNMKFEDVERSEIKEEDERIIYRCSDGKHHFMLLRPEDLSEEGNIMKNCVGGYVEKVRHGRSLIVSLRDEKNVSHVTIEVDVETGMSIQIRGKANTDPSGKYKRLIAEFAIFAAGYGEQMDKEILELLNMKFD
jgi:hypothetical protein